MSRKGDADLDPADLDNPMCSQIRAWLKKDSVDEISDFANASVSKIRQTVAGYAPLSRETIKYLPRGTSVELRAWWFYIDYVEMLSGTDTAYGGTGTNKAGCWKRIAWCNELGKRYANQGVKRAAELNRHENFASLVDATIRLRIFASGATSPSVANTSSDKVIGLEFMFTDMFRIRNGGYRISPHPLYVMHSPAMSEAHSGLAFQSDGRYHTYLWEIRPQDDRGAGRKLAACGILQNGWFKEWPSRKCRRRSELHS